MREALARFGSLGRKALILGALIGAPALATAPAAQAAPIQPAIAVATPEAQFVPVQWGPLRPHYRPHRHWHRPPPPPPRHWHRRYAYGYPPPPPRYYRHPRPYYYR
jgi:hypothetical protein